MTASLWRIGQLLNSVQSTFVGLLRLWSIPLVLLLSIASGYTTYYGMSHFITGWIALIITIAVQSVIVVCCLELAGTYWRANPWRFSVIGLSLAIAVVVSVSFSYFKFYEISQRENLLIARHQGLSGDISRYLEGVGELRSKLMAAQHQRAEQTGREASQAYVGAHPAMQGEFRNKVGRGPFWSHYHELHQAEQAKLQRLEGRFAELDRDVAELRVSVSEFSMHMEDPVAYERIQKAFQNVQLRGEALASSHGMSLSPAPRFGTYAEFSRGITPSFAMWEDVSWFALACAAMVDFFTLFLSYRLEFTAPGPLTEKEQDLAYQGLREFTEFTINTNDELQVRIEKTELERARRYPDWKRMFTVAFLLNRGYLRKIDAKTVEFAPTLYPVIAERMDAHRSLEGSHAANEDPLQELVAQLEQKAHG